MGAPKALLDYGGVSFLERIMEAAVAAGLKPSVVVLGHDADKILKSIDLSGAVVVRSESLEAGPIGSIRAGIRAVLNHPVEAALVWHVDQPHVEVATVLALVDAFRAGHRQVVVPVYRGRRGHPVLFDRRLFEELLGAENSEGARVVVRRDPGRVAQVEVEDPAVISDINTREEYRALVRRLDASAGGPSPFSTS